MSQLEKIYGVHAVEALLRHHPKRVKQIWLAEGRSDPRVKCGIALSPSPPKLGDPKKAFASVKVAR